MHAQEQGRLLLSEAEALARTIGRCTHHKLDNNAQVRTSSLKQDAPVQPQTVRLGRMCGGARAQARLFSS